MLAFVQTHAALVVILVGALVISLHLARAGQAPLIVDGLFAALVIARPSLAGLALLVVQAGARRVPIVARGLATFGTLPPWLQPVLLPGASSTPATAQAPAATGPTTALPTPPPSTAAEALALRSWLDWANRTPTAPHLAVTGPSRSGKTTLTLAVLADREGELVITTPKAASTDPWGGFPAVRLSVTATEISYAPIVNAISQVYRELLRRNAEDTIPHDPWLTLVIDDYSTVVAEAPEVRPMVLRLWTLGASARIRVIIIDCEENVRAWGIEGRGEARANLVFIRLADDHRATMYRWGQTPTPIATNEVKRLADAARLAGRVWRGLSVCLPSPAPDSGLQTAQTDRQTDRQTADHQAKIALLAELRGRMGREEARSYLAARGIKFDNKDWTEAGVLLATAAPPTA